MTSTIFISEPFKVSSPMVEYSETEILAKYTYNSSIVRGTTVHPRVKEYKFKTKINIPKTGVMLVGWGGNNGTTLTAGILANKHNMIWTTKDGEQYPNYFGSITQSSTVKLGMNEEGNLVYTPLKNILPMVNPNDLIIGGWDISSMNLANAMQRAKVIDYDLQKQLRPHMEHLIPLPSIYYEDFIAANQSERADNVLQGTKQQHLDQIRTDITHFKALNNIDKVIIVWSANTERYSDIIPGINDTSSNLLAAIQRGESEISPSTIFAVASILEGCTFINGSPQNTFVPGVIELAEERRVMIAGDDFKSGQTKMKSSLVDLLVGAGIKPVSIVSYNHLGNNDGKNLSAPEQFRSKEISKSSVVDDVVESNRILYKEGEYPDHCVVIKYVPYVGDSKRALDEYTSEIFLNGKNTIVIHNTCEDSLLATPLIIDLIVLAEIADRIEVSGVSPLVFPFEKLHPVLSLLSYLLKAPVVPPGAPVVNALGPQRQCLVNFLMACVGLPPDDNLLLEHKIPVEINENRRKRKLQEDGLLGNVGNGHHEAATTDFPHKSLRSAINGGSHYVKGANGNGAATVTNGFN